MPENDKLQSIVAEALEHDAQSRPRVLDELCGGDADLRCMAAALVEAQDAVRRNIDRLLNFSEEDLTLPAMSASITNDDVTEAQDTKSGAANAPRRSFSQPAGSPEIDGYSPIRILGEGGMGVVWEAIQNSTRRSVALKLMLDNRGTTSAHLRFQREVELAGRLVHPFIARIYDSGVDRRSFYYAMELVLGVALTHFARDRKLTTRDAVVLFRKVCEGVGHAHAQGVIHRDLKPSNILVDGNGEPKLLDFGLAKFIREEGEDPAGDMTVSGAIMGTPAYMSPEQADGDAKAADTRGDVYTLGVIFFELLTGRMPHDTSGTPTAMVRRIVEEEPKRLRQVRPDLDGELEAIIMRCLARKPDDRYTTAKELSDDLGHYLRGEPVNARPATTLYILRKQVARHRYRYGIAAAVVVSGISGTVFYVLSINAERDNVKRALVTAEGRRQEAQKNLIVANEQRAVALQTLSEMIFNVQRELRDSTLSVEFRKRLLDTATQGLDRLGAALSDPQLQTDRLSLSAALQMGDLYQAAGRHKEAANAYSISLGGFERRERSDPSSVQARRDLISAHLRVGRFESASGSDGDSAKSHFERAMELGKSLHAEAPADPEINHDLFAAEIAVGDWRTDHDDATAAAIYKEAALLAPPDSADASTAAVRVAAASLRFAPDSASELKSAGEMLERVIAVQEKRGDQANSPAAIQLHAAALCRLAEINLKLGETSKAPSRAQQAVEALGALVVATPDRSDWKLELAAAHFIAGRCSEAIGNREQATQSFESAVKLMEQLDRTNPLSPRHRSMMEEARKRISVLRKG